MQELDLSVDLNAASATEQEAAWTSSFLQLYTIATSSIL